jgi:hypothetical protein
MIEIFMDYIKTFIGTKLHEEISMRNIQCSLKSNKLTSKTPVTRGLHNTVIDTFLWISSLNRCISSNSLPLVKITDGDLRIVCISMNSLVGLYLFIETLVTKMFMFESRYKKSLL